MAPITLDTADRRLRRQEIAVEREPDRARGGGGHRWTLRLPAAVGKARFADRDHGWEGIADVPPAALTELLAGLTGGRALVPVGDRPSGTVADGPGTGPGRSEVQSVAAVVRRSLGRSHAELVAQDLGLRLGGHVEFVHQARVATRSLRSDLRTFGPLLDRAWAHHLRAELGWLADVLGEVRDLDVLADRLAARRLDLRPVGPSGWDALGHRLTDDHRAATASLRLVVASRRYLDLLGELDAALGDPSALPWAPGSDPQGPASPRLASLVRRPWRQLRRQVAGLGADPSDAELHRVRIRAKQLRFACEAVAPAVGRPATRLAKRAKTLQRVLGDHQDAVASRAWLARTGAVAAADEAFAAGQADTLEVLDQRRAAADWPAAWAALDHKRLRFW